MENELAIFIAKIIALLYLAAGIAALRGVIDFKKKKLEFAGANNPLCLVRNNEIIQIKGDRQPIGG